MRRVRTQQEIDNDQDKTNIRQDLVNFYQTTVLLVYGVVLGALVVLILMGVIK